MTTVKKFIQNKIFLMILILVVASVLRLWNLSNNPPSLTPDETAIGYNAYSILKTGKDEYGTSFPIIFKSFGDYKPGLYIYTTVPFVAVFGLNEFSVRLPSVIFGIIAVYLLYKVIELIAKRDQAIDRRLPLVAAFLLALSPWHISLSRGAWEVNLALTLTLFGIYFFLKSFQKPKMIILSSLFFALTLLTYQGAKLSTSIVLFVLFISFYKEVLLLTKSSYKVIIAGVILGLFTISPIVFSIFNGQAGRLTVFSIFSYERPKEYIEYLVTQGSERPNGMSYYLFHSETLNYGRAIMGRWFNHFSPRFLFFEGDWQNPRHTPPNHGVATVFDLVLFICGFIALARLKIKPLQKFVGLWLILSPLPAILSRDEVHAVRSFNMVIPLTILFALGILLMYSMIINIKNFAGRTFCLLFIVLCFLSSYFYFLDSYFVHQPIHNAKLWQYGYKQVVQSVLPIEDKYDEIIMQESYAQPYIYFLFYEKYDPKTYQSEANLLQKGSDVGIVEKLGNIHFKSFSWPQQIDKKTLIIGDTVGISDSVDIDKRYHVLKTIKNPDGTVAFRIVEGGENE